MIFSKKRRKRYNTLVKHIGNTHEIQKQKMIILEYFYFFCYINTMIEVLITSRGVSTRCTDEQQRAPAAKKRSMILLVNFLSRSIGQKRRME